MKSWPAPSVPALPGGGPQLRLYDSADRQVRPVTAGETATMYVCGITPYDATHLGHAATYLTFDLVYRVWLDSGHRVHYVQNVTDVDDPLFERAERDGIDWRDLADRETELFREDMAALRVLPPHDYVAATEAIAEVIELVEKMLASGAAYVVDDAEYPDVYYRADATGQFGYESGYDRDTMLRLFGERGGDPDRPGKGDPLDALMWRAQRPGEPSWPSPFGPGRPGWHVECSAIALSRIGTGLDIQGGGSDLIFPHHEFSAAHAESVTGERRFARHYVHAGMIGWDGHKMSKSRGNLVLVLHCAAITMPPEFELTGDYDPVWSVDGTSLLLHGVEIPVDGSTPRLLLPDDPRSQSQFSFSPNGADIAYVSPDGLYVAAADGSRARQLVPQDPDDTLFWWYGAEWSPAGGQIAFVNQPGGESSDGSHVNELTLVDVVSGTLVPLADMGGGLHEYSSKITFSPKGDQILFTRIDATGAKSLWTIKTDGSDLRRLVDGSEWGEWQTLGPTG